MFIIISRSGRPLLELSVLIISHGLNSDSGQAIIEVCCNVFSKVLAAKTVQLFKTPLRDTWIRLTRDPLRKGNFNDISKTIEDLSEEIGEEFAKKLSSVRDINPGMWTPTLENYIDTVLE
ncbi:unnamed protein product [Rhizophagus irregularis]|nr:unnamed protein product [Rhizophagus irregularis]